MNNFLLLNLRFFRKSRWVYTAENPWSSIWKNSPISFLKSPLSQWNFMRSCLDVVILTPSMILSSAQSIIWAQWVNEFHFFKYFYVTLCSFQQQRIHVWSHLTIFTFSEKRKLPLLIQASLTLSLTSYLTIGLEISLQWSGGTISGWMNRLQTLLVTSSSPRWTSNQSQWSTSGLNSTWENHGGN